MKKILCVLLVTALVLLCGCQKEAPAEESVAPSGTDFAATTVYDDDVLSFEVTSAALTDNGISYAVVFKNKTDETVNVEVSNITVNGKQTDIALSATVEKGATSPTTLALPLAIGETAAEVGLHLEVTPANRWWVSSLVSRDLIFYPVPQATATATATATNAT